METAESLGSGGSADDRTMMERLSDFVERVIRKRSYSYFYMVIIMIYLLLSGYILLFSGSLFIEAVIKGWWKPDASEFDSNSLFLGYLFGFPSLLGVVGGIAVLSTSVKSMFKFKVLFFVPSVVWSFLLVLDILRRPVQDWYHWIYLIPALLLCSVILFSVVKKVQLPYSK